MTTEVRVLASFGLLGMFGVAGCFSNDDNNSGGPSDLSSTSKVMGQAANLISTLNTVDRIADAAQVSNAKASGGFDCDAGSEGQFTSNGVEVDSPYTEQSFSLSGARWENCRVELPEHNGQQVSFTINGVSVGGAVSEGEDSVQHVRVGANETSPWMTMNVELEGRQGGISYSTDFDYNISIVQNSRYDGAGNRESSMYSAFNGRYDTFAFDFDFGFHFGASEAEPFVISNSTVGTILTGAYGMSMDDVPGQDFDDCVGETMVTTTDPLVRSGSGFSAGILRLSNEGGSATIEFAGDSLTVTSADGTIQTYAQSELSNYSNDCAGLFMTGLSLSGL